MIQIKYNIAIIGSGNIAHLFAEYWFKNQHNIQFILSRNTEEGENLANKVNAKFSKELKQNFNGIDLLFIAVSDNSISKVVENINLNETIVCHTSGTTSISVLSTFKNRAVIYPLQSISKNKSLNYNQVPILLESSDLITNQKIKQLLLDFNVSEMNSEQRLKYHLAAVFANNFTNALWLMTEQLCKEQKIEFDLLNPLIKETTDKMLELGAVKAQTGPAKRHDTETLKKHIEMLSQHKELQNLYILMSEYIESKY